MRLVSATFLALIGGCTVGYQARVIAPPPPVIAVGVSADVGPAPAPMVVTGAAVDVEPAPAPVEYVQPELVDVSPGVQVVYDYDYPVFFVNGFYWHQEGGLWYSSHYHTGGWVRISSPPREVVAVRNPGGYTHYHPAGYQPHRAPEPVRVGGVRPAPGRVEPVRPVEGRPVEGRPEPIRPVEGRPVEGRPVEGHPVEGRPMEPVRPEGRPVAVEPAHPIEPVRATGAHVGGVAAQPVRPAAPVHTAPVGRPVVPPRVTPPTKHK